MKPIGILGTGFLGTVSAIGLAELGCNVVGFDSDPERVTALQRGAAPYGEPHLNELLRKHNQRGRTRFTSNQGEAVRGAGLIFLSVGVPAGDDGAADLRGLLASVHGLAATDLSACEALVLRSAVPPGTCDEVTRALGGQVPVVYGPAFLREGTAIADFLAPDRIVVGSDDLDAAVAYASLFEPLGVPVMITTCRNAELIKAASDAYMAMKITFANEITNLCEALGADADDVLRGVGYDQRIGSALLVPGSGFGGSSLEIELKSLCRVAQRSKVPLELAEATLSANGQRPERIIEIVAEELGRLDGRKIAVWGLALRIIGDLVARGATVTAFDPAAQAGILPKGATLAPTALAALAGADALLVLTACPEFARISPVAIAHALGGVSVIDGRNLLDAERISSAGLHYRGLGRQVEAERYALPVAI